MKQLLLCTFTLIGSVVFAQNPFQPKAETVNAIKDLSFLNGNWTGKGWIQMGPEKHFFNQKETIITKVNGTVVQIEGLGVDDKDPQKVVHQAFAIISYDGAAKKYLMKAYRGDGGQIDAEAKLVDKNVFEWGFSNPMAGRIRYTISVTDGRWFETGEFGRDEGKSWVKYFEMVLNKD